MLPALVAATVPAALVVPTTAAAAPTPTVVPSAAAPTSSNGITVTGAERLTDRTWRLDITTPNVTAKYATHAGMSVRVTLPADYETSGKRYPTLYLLHGQDGRSSDWTQSGDLEKISAGRDVIVVTPEGGKASWYTDWVRQWGGRQSWQTFHTKQLIPFIDANYRTKADGRHRAIAGLSMGGYGAMHYAAANPGMFAHASSYSGGVNLSRPEVRFAVLFSVNDQGLGLDAPFGSVLPGLDAKWRAENPVDQAAKLRGLNLSIYTGDGRGKADLRSNLIERGAAAASTDLHNRLTTLGIPHTFVNYGHDVTKAGYTCDGSHAWSCWKMSLALDMPAIMRSIS